MKTSTRLALSSFVAVAAALVLHAETPAVPDWAQPGSATHQQVPPPVDFKRATTTFLEPLGAFEGQSDIGTAVVPGASHYDAKAKTYTLTSAGYNIWYTRDEFRFVWKKVSGDVSLAADVSFPNAEGYFDRKAVLVLRQDLEDDSKEIMAGFHGGGLVHLAQRPEKHAEMKENARLQVDGKANLKRLGIEKHGNVVRLFLSVNGEPLKQVGADVTFTLDKPFYVGIGFTSHLPATADTTVLSNVVFEEEAGKVK